MVLLIRYSFCQRIKGAAIIGARDRLVPIPCPATFYSSCKSACRSSACSHQAISRRLSWRINSPGLSRSSPDRISAWR
ncbi:MAG: hypothetical protein VR73_15215 [Gammaproteobacteria bacterium BRH_c0]|nr:MAG: hypothetical protein VR73_15215 [Gammaproteobacteria bacterium BRH_c0]